MAMYLRRNRKYDFNMILLAEQYLLKQGGFSYLIGPQMDCLRRNASGRDSWAKQEGSQCTKKISSIEFR